MHCSRESAPEVSAPSSPRNPRSPARPLVPAPAPLDDGAVGPGDRAEGGLGAVPLPRVPGVAVGAAGTGSGWGGDWGDPGALNGAPGVASGPEGPIAPCPGALEPPALGLAPPAPCANADAPHTIEAATTAKRETGANLIDTSMDDSSIERYQAMMRSGRIKGGRHGHPRTLKSSFDNKREPGKGSADGGHEQRATI